MAMLEMPAARRNHKSRTGYTFGLMALVGAALTLVVLVRYPAESATRLAEPVPAPEITVVEAPPDDGSLGDSDDWAGTDGALPTDDVPAHAGHGADAGPTDDIPADAGPGVAAGPVSGTARSSGIEPGGGGGEESLADAPARRSFVDQRQALSRSLFWAGSLGLAVSLAGLGLVGSRRRRW
ncbi:hypothetical protein E1193_10310 [Micromonospora sp. KC606]|uniref:hypothetical protein n=1 Tax=Micromonospora sp. KC606 TaxID=2530379 RepID=UPI00104F6E96|nr:hypothetical protein [Micromonospora sp. KC606]TDC82945.1 hypothetical protein E1193_10310 [Micromonospora sp. KC606]